MSKVWRQEEPGSMDRESNPALPSDVTVCGVMAAFGSDQHLAYSPYVHPITSNGIRCVVVDMRLEGIEPMAYRFLLSFAKDNDLKVRPGRPPERTKLAEVGRGGGGGDA